MMMMLMIHIQMTKDLDLNKKKSFKKLYERENLINKECMLQKKSYVMVHNPRPYNKMEEQVYLKIQDFKKPNMKN